MAETVAHDALVANSKWKMLFKWEAQTVASWMWPIGENENKQISHFKGFETICYPQLRAEILFYEATIANFLLWKKIWEQNI